MCLSDWQTMKTLRKPNANGIINKLALSFAVSWSINWYFIFGRQFGNFYQNVIKFYQNIFSDTAIPLLGISPTETKIHRDGCIRIFAEVLCKTGKNWKQSKCPPGGEGYINYAKSMLWNNVQLLKSEWNLYVVSWRVLQDIFNEKRSPRTMCVVWSHLCLFKSYVCVWKQENECK